MKGEPTTKTKIHKVSSYLRAKGYRPLLAEGWMAAGDDWYARYYKAPSGKNMLVTAARNNEEWIIEFLVSSHVERVSFDVLSRREDPVEGEPC